MAKMHKGFDGSKEGHAGEHTYTKVFGAKYQDKRPPVGALWARLL